MIAPPGKFRQALDTTILPVVLVALCPPATGVVWYTDTRLDGSLSRLVQAVAADGVIATLRHIWGPVILGSPTAWCMLLVFAAVELAFRRLLPGRSYAGPAPPGGEAPVYRANGPLALALTLVLFLAGSFGLGLFPATIIYDQFRALLGALNVIGVLFCLLLYVKARLGGNGGSGNPIFDYYWGLELHPRILGWDVKTFTNCRFGMMAWPLILVSFAAKQQALTGTISDAMAVAVGLQLIYVAKFFWWETGYVRSLDMMHDRAGFYICWGCLAWLPALYPSATLYLVGHPQHLGLPVASALFAVGVAAIAVNYQADLQRQSVRASDGAVTIWGKRPVLIRAAYQGPTGEPQINLLLASGWWGVARHFHYVPEFVAALCWTAPVLFDAGMPWIYPAYLAILLVHRAFRDDRRCAEKYGKDWSFYCARVPYRLIPGLL